MKYRSMRSLVMAGILGVPLAALACQSTSSSSTSSARRLGAASADAPPTNQYHGFLKLPHRSTRMPVTLDLVRIGTDATPEQPVYRAFFRMAAGGFDSHEYVTLYFADVRWDAATSSLKVARGTTNAQLTDVMVSPAGIKGNVVTDSEGVVAPFELELDLGDGNTPKAFAGMPIAGHVTGHYVASCGDHREALQLEASRWRGRSAADDTLFGGYRVVGRRGGYDEIVCGDRDKACVSASYPDVSVDFLARTMVLSRSKKGQDEASQAAGKCRMQGAKINCDTNCSFERESDAPHTVLDVVREQERHERQVHLPSDKGGTAPRGRGGQYYGYLHHENRDVYQLIALNVKAAPEIDIATGEPVPGAPAREHVAAVATLYFGQGDSSEFIAYRFKETMAPAAPGSAIVFDGEGEGIFVIDDWQAKTIRGTWYGKTYGRVGTIELTRDLVPELDPKVMRMQSLSGVYRGDDWDFEMAASANLSEEATAFYPLKLFGWARERLQSSRRRSIEDGAYDFYTGALAFRLDDGRTVLGQVASDVDGHQALELHWAPLPRLGSSLTTADYRVFKRVSDSDRPQARLGNQP